MPADTGRTERSPIRTALVILSLGGKTDGRSLLRFTAIVVSGGALARGTPRPIGAERAAAIGVGCAA